MPMTYSSAVGPAWTSWSTASCCAQLASTLGSLVSYPGTSVYNASQASYWSLQESDLNPACVFKPLTSEHVAQAVTILASPLNEACQFAIKGQTHAPAAGFANINGGVTIDMTGLNSTDLVNDQSVVRVGGGTSWIDIYRYLDSEELAVAGGRNGAVGIGGLLLGGGISHFTTRVGFACDNVVNFEVVLPSGVLTNVNKTSYPDLFLALKGGATNFGIVTRFDLATFPQGQMSVNSVVNLISHRDRVFQAFTEITTSDFDPYVSLVSSILFNSTSKAWTMSSSAVYTKPVPNPAPFQELLTIPNLSNSTKLLNLSTFAAEPATPPLNWLFWTGTYTASADLMSGIFTILNDTLYDFNVPEGVVWSIAFEPLPSLIQSISKSKGGNVLGLNESDGNAFIILISPLWPSSASNEAVQSVALRAGESINTYASSKGMLRQFQYINYADPSQSPLENYGQSNLAMLRSVSQKYDPKGIFQRRVPGGFKLW